MNRFLTLLALTTVSAFAAEPVATTAVQTPATTGAKQYYNAESLKQYYNAGPVSAGEDTILARTDFSYNHAKLPRHIKHERTDARKYDMYSFNTIQPLYLSQDQHCAAFGFAGVGMTKFEKGNVSWGAGLGTRHLTACGCHMFGVGAFYKEGTVRHVKVRGPGAYAEWFTNFTTVTLSRSLDRDRVARGAWKNYLKHHTYTDTTGLDISTQLPFLPWTQVSVGKTWRNGQVGRKSYHSYNHCHDWNHNRFDYGLKLNLLSCLSVEAGRQGTGAYTMFTLSYGRPATREYTLADGLIGDSLFTERDLRSQMLASPSRTRIN